MFIDNAGTKSGNTRYRVDTPERVLNLFRFDLKKFGDPSFNDRRKIERWVDALNKQIAFVLLPFLDGRDAHIPAFRSGVTCRISFTIVNSHVAKCR